ncbi:hypothetical protein C8F01DRAFT_1257084 [Mycena amicta]|nr:hypothetical protein C8F01DRAFT_1257084 [Mycena amicta]
MTFRSALTPTQPGNRVPAAKISLSNSNCAIPDSTTAATLTRADEDATLYYENDMTACASTPSGLGITIKTNTGDLPFHLLALAQLPEIPDWYDDPEPHTSTFNASPALETPALAYQTPQSDYYSLDHPPYETPQSDYQSFEEHQPDALCLDDVLRELEETAEQAHAHNVSQSSKISGVVAFGFPSPGFTTVAGKHKVDFPDRELMTLSPYRRPVNLQQHQQRRRSYSLDSADRRPAELVQSDAGLGLGLGSPFCLSQLQVLPDPITPCNIDMQLHALHAHPDSLADFASPEIVYSGPGTGLSSERRQEALAVERPDAPAPIPESLARDADVGPDDDEDWDDIRSASVPFPSTASLYAFPTSASWPAARTKQHSSSACGGRSHIRAHQKQRPTRKWTLEEQITIAVLAAMDARDAGIRSGTKSGSRNMFESSKGKGKLLRLLRKVWRKEARDGDSDGSV